MDFPVCSPAALRGHRHHLRLPAQQHHPAGLDHGIEREGRPGLALAPAAAVAEQSFSLTFDYPVHFTDNSLDPENTSLVQVISRLEPDTRHKLNVFVDQGVLDSWPKLDEMIGSRAAPAR